MTYAEAMATEAPSPRDRARTDRARTDRLHSGAHVQRYRVQLDQPLARLVMLEMDLSGEHPTQRFQWITKGSDLVMFVSDVTQPDFGIPTALLERCRVAQVPMIVVLTHVDRMAAIEELKTRLGRKACSELDEAICRAVDEDRGRFGKDVTVVPLWVDQDRGEMYGINQRLIPALAAVLTKAQSRVVLEAIAAPSCESQVARAGKASSREQSV